MALAELRTGIVVTSDGAVNPARSDKTAAQVVTDAHGRYYEMVARGNAYVLATTGAAVTAFSGAAAGTPLLSVFNPSGSGKNLVVTQVGVAVQAQASVIGGCAFGLFGGVSAKPTSTNIAPTNLLTFGGGSVAQGSTGALTTGSSALAFLLPVGAHLAQSGVTGAPGTAGPALIDVAGLVVCAPGNMVAFGGSTALTSGTYNVAMAWEEVNA